MPLSNGDRVQVSRQGSPMGTVKSLVGEDGAYVKLDSGPACTFPLYELSKMPVEEKAWPPPGLETK